MSDEATGADDVIEAVPVLVVGVLPFHEDILVAHVLGFLIDDPGPTLHPDGVAAADVGAELRTVTAAFVELTLEVLVFEEEDLEKKDSASDHIYKYHQYTAIKGFKFVVCVFCCPQVAKNILQFQGLCSDFSGDKRAFLYK